MENTKKKKGKGVSCLLLVLISGAIGCLLGVGLAKFMDARGEWGLPEIIVLIVSFILAHYASVIIHEAGHLVCGLMSGYRFISFRIRKSILCRKNGKWGIYRFSLPGTAGQCLMDPPDPIDGKYPLVLYNLGGSLFNLLSAIPTVLLIFLFPNMPTAVFILLACFSIYATVGAATNGIPMRLAVANDGRNLLDCRRDPVAARAFWLTLRVHAYTAEGKRIREIPAVFFELPPREKWDNLQVASCVVQIVQRYLDEERFAEAKALIDELLARDVLVQLQSGILKYQRIYCELLTENRTELIAAWRNDDDLNFILRSGLKTMPDVIGYRYALARLIDGNEAAAAAERALLAKVAPKYPYPSEVEGCLELMAAVDRAFAARAAA